MEPKEEIKKSNILLESIVSDYLDKCKRHALKPNQYMSHELELSFGNRKPIGRTDYENVIHHLMRYGWTTNNIHGDEMIRINSEFMAAAAVDAVPPVNVQEPNTNEMIGKMPNESHPIIPPPSDGAKIEVLGGATNAATTTTKMRMSTTFRLEIVGSKLIQEYCKHDSIDAIKKIDAGYMRKMKFTEKKRVLQKDNTFFNDARFTDHNFRVAYKIENDNHVDNVNNPKVRETMRN